MLDPLVKPEDDGYSINMISKEHRFAGQAGLRYVYRHGQTIRGPLFSVKAALNPRRRGYRVAVVISRKVHKSAVARNRMRRRIYEIVRNLEEDITQPYDLVVTVFNESLLSEPPQSLARQLKKQLMAAGVLPGKRGSTSRSSQP